MPNLHAGPILVTFGPAAITVAVALLVHRLVAGRRWPRGGAGTAAEVVAARDRRWESLLARSSELVVVLDGDLQVTYASPPARRALGGRAGRPAGRDARSLLRAAGLDDLRPGIEGLLAHPGGTFRVAAHRFRHVDGRRSWLDVTATNLLDDPDVRGIVCNVRDVTDRIEAEDELRHQATHDALTQLPNRTALHRWVERRTSGKGPYGLSLLDLDGFKEINDALGHRAGDELLCRVAARLRASVGPDDVVGRLGGDEFAALVSGVDGAGLEAQAARLLAAIAEPVDLGGRILAATASAGCTVDASGELDRALQEADIAMYRAKRTSGRGACASFGSEDEQDRVLDLELGAALRRAIADRELQVWYQVKVDARTGLPTGVEALSRWTHPVHGPIPPDRFVALAQRAGLVVELTELVLDRSIDQAVRWCADGMEVAVAVNVSPGCLLDRRFAAGVLARLEQAGLPPRLLEVEITEEALADPTEVVLANLEQLRSAGVTVAIDDFGTGYSSLSYLKELPVDTLKIDRSFVAGLADDGTDREIVAAICTLGRSLGLTIVAEGVETQAVADRLVAIGCTTHQGYHHHRPSPPADATADLARRWEGARSTAG